MRGFSLGDKTWKTVSKKTLVLSLMVFFLIKLFCKNENTFTYFVVGIGCLSYYTWYFFLVLKKIFFLGINIVGKNTRA